MNLFKQAIATLLLAIVFNSAFAQNEAEMKAWKDYMTPGDVHKMLAKSDGEWKTTVTMWMQPGAQPMVSQGKVVNKMILGGRYQESDFSGDFMGQPMEGKGTLAFDNAKKEFQSTWIDNMGTGIMTMNGPWDAATKTINFSGTMVEPTNGKEMKVRETFQIVDDKNQVMQMFVTPPNGAKEYKSMEIKFTKS